MPKLAATQNKPAENPAPKPSASDGRGPRKVANIHAASRHSTKVRPKIFALLLLLICSSVRPTSRCQALPNSAGEYHRPPSTKLPTAATTMAIQLTSGMTPPLLLWRDSAPRVTARLGKNGNRGNGGEWGHS